MEQHISDKQLVKFFSKNSLQGSIHYYQNFKRRVRYITINNNCSSTLFFIHGAPASLMESKEYFIDPQLRKNFNMIAIDRPGYGRSEYGNPEPSIKKQAELLKEILEACCPEHPLIIYAASYGASVACRLLMDHTDIAEGLVLMAPSLAPGQEKYFWLTPIIERSFIRKIILPHHRTSNAEKFYHKIELEKMLPYWKNISVPVMYLQGQKDRMIYVSNAVFASEQLVNAPWLEINFFPGQPHVVGKKFTPLVVQKIFELYDQIEAVAKAKALQ
jgi:uncharacterized protein